MVVSNHCAFGGFTVLCSMNAPLIEGTVTARMVSGRADHHGGTFDGELDEAGGQSRANRSRPVVGCTTDAVDSDVVAADGRDGVGGRHGGAGRVHDLGGGGGVRPGDGSVLDEVVHRDHGCDGVVERRLHRRWCGCRGDRHRCRSGAGSGDAGQDHLRAGSVVGVAGGEPAQSGHQRSWDVHGRLDRREGLGVDRAVCERAGVGVSRDRPGCSDRERQGGHRRRWCRRVTGGRSDQLGDPAQERQRDEHPDHQLVLRNQLHSGRWCRSAVVRGREGLEGGHRGRRRCRQQRLPERARFGQSGIQPVRDRCRWLRHSGDRVAHRRSARGLFGRYRPQQ